MVTTFVDYSVLENIVNIGKDSVLLSFGHYTEEPVYTSKIKIQFHLTLQYSADHQ